MKRFRNVTVLLLLIMGLFTLSGQAMAEEPMCIAMEANSVSVYQGQ